MLFNYRHNRIRIISSSGYYILSIRHQYFRRQFGKCRIKNDTSMTDEKIKVDESDEEYKMPWFFTFNIACRLYNGTVYRNMVCVSVIMAHHMCIQVFATDKIEKIYS